MLILCNLIHFPGIITCSYTRYVVLTKLLETFHLLRLCVEKMCSIPYFLLKIRHNSRRKVG